MRYLLVLLVLLLTANAQFFDPNPCGTQKGCLFAPTGCNPQQPGSCRISFSYLEVNNRMDMELYGPVTGDGYIALGFSNDQSMGDDTVVWCGSQGGQVQVGLSYNQGRSNVPIAASGIQQPNNVNFANGNVYCSFSQPVNAGVQNVKRLNAIYYPLMATGPLQNGALQFHGDNKFILPRTDFNAYRRGENGITVVSSTGSVAGGGRSHNDKLRIAHGILMVLSFGIFLASGILFARHFRNHWPETIFLGVKMWFNLHRSLNIIGIAGSICGFVIIFVASDWRWSGPKAGAPDEQNRQWGSIHSILGLLACVIAWAQPLNAVFRCDPHSRVRFIFNWIHRFFGFSSYILALAAVMIAVWHFNTNRVGGIINGLPGMFSNDNAARGIWIAYVAVVGVTLIILEILSVMNWWTVRKVGPEMEMTRLGSSSVPEYERVNRVQNLQSAIMCVFLICAIGLCVALCVLIGLKPVA